MIRRFLKISVTFALFLILGLILMNMVARHLGVAGIAWADVAIPHTVLWVGFLGAILATLENHHISIEILPNILPEKWKRPVFVFRSLVTSGLSGWLAWAAWKFIEQEKGFGEVLFFGLTSWELALIVPIMFAMITVITLWRLLRT